MQVDHVAWVCDQDAYACSGRKCSAQSILFVHENWGLSELIFKMNSLAGRRKLEYLTIVPVLTVVTEYRNDELELVLEACERMHAHLTAAVVSNDPLFLQIFFFLINTDLI